MEDDPIIFCYCTGCGELAKFTVSDYVKRPHPVYFCEKCLHYDDHWCIWGEPTETQNPYMVRHCVKKDQLVMRVNCTKDCEYWKEYTDPKLSPEELILVKEKWKIAGICQNPEKVGFKHVDILVDKTLCENCQDGESFETERDRLKATEEVQEERARELIQKDCIPIKEDKPKPKGKISVQKRLF